MSRLSAAFFVSVALLGCAEIVGVDGDLLHAPEPNVADTCRQASVAAGTCDAEDVAALYYANNDAVCTHCFGDHCCDELRACRDGTACDVFLRCLLACDPDDPSDCAIACAKENVGGAKDF